MPQGNDVAICVFQLCSVSLLSWSLRIKHVLRRSVIIPWIALDLKDLYSSVLFCWTNWSITYLLTYLPIINLQFEPFTNACKSNTVDFNSFFEQAGEETPQRVSPIESPADDRGRTPGESSASFQPDLQNRVSSPTNENVITQADGEAKQKKKKKRRRKLNKTAPLEEENYRLPPLNAWDAPPATLNGLPGSSGVSPRRLEPLGPPRGQGILLSVLKTHDV